ncbi:hypothetical protein A0H81_02725 [Grifola frondosa]|uniref:Uncharacterized protein n=1 Tax=Grifola frondosa TaxID=5627 RepID=A0A1C7MLD0_GRIFR|nr:hypothetical protein A0H81_02725 [Grifola frondosa]
MCTAPASLRIGDVDPVETLRAGGPRVASLSTAIIKFGSWKNRRRRRLSYRDPAEVLHQSWLAAALGAS